MDRIEAPGESVTERGRTRMVELPNVAIDRTATPRESLLWADLLPSDCSGIVTEWLHTGRAVVRLTAVVENAHREGLDVVAWRAVKTREEIASLRAGGVDGVTADRWDIA